MATVRPGQLLQALEGSVGDFSSRTVRRPMSRGGSVGMTAGNESTGIWDRSGGGSYNYSSGLAGSRPRL